jgi:homoserine O-acetyltransferase
MFTRILAGCAAIGLLSLATAQAQTAAVDGAQKYAELGSCQLVSGQTISGCRLGYRTWGALNAAKSNAVLFPTWFSGNTQDLAEVVGAQSLVDPAKYFIIAVDALGNGVSSSPSNSKTQPGPLFPQVAIADMVSAEYRLASETLGLKHLHAVMGVSMGGMQTFEWIVRYPDFMDAAVPIVGSTRMNGRDLVLWQLEVDMIRTDPAWQGGWYREKPALGRVNVFHEMNLSTPQLWAKERTAENFGKDYSAMVTKGILPFDANDWLLQLEAMIHHDVAGGGKMDDAAKRVKARVLIVVGKQDHMVNPGPALDFAKLIGAKVMALDSECGHGSAGCESDTVNPAVRAFLDGK